MTEGKMARGWRLTRESWSVVRTRPGLLVIPALAAVMTIVAAVLLLGPWSLDILGHHSRTRVFIDLAICSYPFTVISTFFNVAFAALAAAVLDGRPMTVGEAFARARTRLGAVALWALIATLVGIAVRALEQLPFAGGLAGRAAEWLAGLAWALATYFVVPVLALEDISAGRAVRRSADTIRRSWGESVTGAVVIGGAFGLVAGAAVVVAAIGLLAGHGGFTPGYLVAAAAILAVAACSVVQTAVTQVFRLAVYRYATESGATGPYAADDLRGAFRPRARRFWR